MNRGQDEGADDATTIRITERELAWLSDSWSRLWRRPPNDDEMRGLVVDYLREELLAREALGLELDRDDIIIRRRLAQKMNFILEDTGRLASPTEEDLRALYAAEPARYAEPPRISFVNVYFSADRRSERAAGDAQAALGRLSAGGTKVDPATIGDSSLLPSEFMDSDEQAIAGVFGEDFARSVIRMKPGDWQGPVESAFGQHLVRVTARTEPGPRPFEQVRDALAQEWQRRHDEAAKQTYFRGLLERYDIQATDSVRPVIEPALATLRGDAK